MALEPAPTLRLFHVEYLDFHFQYLDFDIFINLKIDKLELDIFYS